MGPPTNSSSLVGMRSPQRIGFEVFYVGAGYRYKAANANVKKNIQGNVSRLDSYVFMRGEFSQNSRVRRLWVGCVQLATDWIRVTSSKGSDTTVNLDNPAAVLYDHTPRTQPTNHFS